MFPVDLTYIVVLAPAIMLAAGAHLRIRTVLNEAHHIAAPLSGADAARRILDAAGLQHIAIRKSDSMLLDHYDVRDKTLHLSPLAYDERSMAAVGLATHEAGHAIQDAHQYLPLIVRSAAVPAANFGGIFSLLLIVTGLVGSLAAAQLASIGVWTGIATFLLVVLLELANLPVEQNASMRAKNQLVALGVIQWPQQEHVRKVLDAAAWTHVAATVWSIATLFYLPLRARRAKQLHE